MKPTFIHQRAKRIDPSLSFRELIELVNEGMREAYDILGEEAYETANVVEDQRFVDLGDDTITEVLELYYMDSEGRYRPLDRLIGRADIGDQT
ncbi:hypothetical protein ACFL4H_00045 [Candidatus Neomarinimicrobiota bacterium]